MANITDNRINQTISPADLTAINAAIANLNASLSFLQALTDEERVALLGLDVNNKVFVDEALDEMTNNGAILPAFISTGNLKNDVTLFEQLDSIESELLNLVSRISDTKRIAGHEAYAISLTAYNMYAMASNAGIPGAKQSYDRLKVRFAGQGRTSQPTV
jgi:hypothetical protein